MQFDYLATIRSCEGNKYSLEEIEKLFMDYNLTDTNYTKEKFSDKLKDREFRESLKMPFGNMHTSWMKIRAKVQEGDWFETYDMGSWGDLCACAGIHLLRRDSTGKTIEVADMEIERS